MMRNPLSLIGLVLLIVAPLAAASEIYRTTDEDGNVVYTDDPPGDDAEPVELDPLTTVPGTPVDGGDGPAAGDDEAGDDGAGTDAARADAVSGLRIAYPENEAGIRHNGGNVPFRVAFEPEGAALAPGHQVEIVLDGEARARGRGPEVVVAPVDRGAHVVRARVVDASGDVRFESEPVKFFLLRKALGGGGD